MSSRRTDPALRQLLAEEIERRLPALEDPHNLRALLHALRGSAAMAGEPDLSLLLGQAGQRLSAGADPRAVAVAVDRLLRRCLERLSAGTTALGTAWPVPPPELVATPVAREWREEYDHSMRERLGEIDGALASAGEPEAAIEQAYRAIHSMKSAAASVGDDATAWYCHGLESELSAARQVRHGARQALVELARHRALLVALLEDPARGLVLLSRLASSSSPPPSSSRKPAPLGEQERVPPDAVDRLLDRVEQLGLVHDELRASAELARRYSERMHEQRAALSEALRLIGPPRPWGAPAAAIRLIENATRALQRAAHTADRGSVAVARSARRIEDTSTAVRSELAGLRRTQLSWLFDRLLASARDVADQELKLLSTQVSGGELSIDRRVAERLLEPLRQLVKNAVVHGLETPTERVRARKPERGRLDLSAARRRDAIIISIQDDGRGVDVARVTERAGQRATPEDDPLALLFTPGLTTRDAADLLAGRGVGLDLAREAVRRLGGTLTLALAPGGGLAARVEVPADNRLLDVLWVAVGKHWLALPLGATGRLSRPAQPALCVLGRWLGAGERFAPLLLDLETSAGRALLGVDAVGEVETVNPRPLPRLLADVGPYAGAILRQDGSLRLLVDCPTLVRLARAS